METYPRVIRFQDKDGEFRTGFDTSGFFFYNDALLVDLVFGVPEDIPGGVYGPTLDEWILFVRDSFHPALEQDLTAVWPGHIVVSMDWQIIPAH